MHVGHFVILSPPAYLACLSIICVSVGKLVLHHSQQCTNRCQLSFSLQPLVNVTISGALSEQTLALLDQESMYALACMFHQ